MCAAWVGAAPEPGRYTKKYKMNPIKDLQIIPGVGQSLAKDLIDLGIKHVTDLKNRNPETLYKNLNVLRGQHIDR